MGKKGDRRSPLCLQVLPCSNQLQISWLKLRFLQANTPRKRAAYALINSIQMSKLFIYLFVNCDSLVAEWFRFDDRHLTPGRQVITPGAGPASCPLGTVQSNSWNSETNYRYLSGAQF